MVLTFLNGRGEKSKEHYFGTHEHHMNRKRWHPQIKFYWDTAMPVYIRVTCGCSAERTSCKPTEATYGLSLAGRLPASLLRPPPSVLALGQRLCRYSPLWKEIVLSLMNRTWRQ